MTKHISTNQRQDANTDNHINNLTAPRLIPSVQSTVSPFTNTAFLRSLCVHLALPNNVNGVSLDGLNAFIKKWNIQHENDRPVQEQKSAGAFKNAAREFSSSAKLNLADAEQAYARITKSPSAFTSPVFMRYLANEACIKPKIPITQERFNEILSAFNSRQVFEGKAPLRESSKAEFIEVSGKSTVLTPRFIVNKLETLGVQSEYQAVSPIHGAMVDLPKSALVQYNKNLDPYMVILKTGPATIASDKFLQFIIENKVGWRSTGGEPIPLGVLLKTVNEYNNQEKNPKDRVSFSYKDFAKLGSNGEFITIQDVARSLKTRLITEAKDIPVPTLDKKANVVHTPKSQELNNEIDDLQQRCFDKYKFIHAWRGGVAAILDDASKLRPGELASLKDLYKGLISTEKSLINALAASQKAQAQAIALHKEMLFAERKGDLSKYKDLGSQAIKQYEFSIKSISTLTQQRLPETLQRSGMRAIEGLAKTSLHYAKRNSELSQ